MAAGSSLRISFSTSSIDFSASAPWAQNPADQEIVGTLSGRASGTLYIIIQVNDPAIDCGNSSEPYSYEVALNYVKKVGSSTVSLTQSGTKPLVGICQ